MALSFAAVLHPLEVLLFDLYLAWGPLHAVNETVDRIAGEDIGLDDPMIQSRLIRVFDILRASNFKLKKAKY